jgi:hypothetical protein
VRLHATNNDDGNEDDEEDDDDDSMVEFDDFGGQVIGGSGDDGILPSSSSSRSMPSSSSNSVLSDRIARVQRHEQRQEAVYARNWKLGNWQVRGFSLEDEDRVAAAADNATTTTTGSGGSIPAVCRIIQAASSSESDDDDDSSIDIWVGRSDGSVFGVRLGDQYWTKLQGTRRDENHADDVTFTTASPNADDDENDEWDEEEDAFTTSNTDQDDASAARPFKILAQFQAGEAAVSAMVAVVSDDDDETSHLFTATGAGGDIQQWTLTEGNTVVSAKTLSNGHESTILSIKSITTLANNNDAAVLLSADSHSLAVWDVATGNLLGRCVVETPSDDRDDSASDGGPIVQCIDTDGAHVYVGTVTGHVMAYAIRDILSSNPAALPAAGQWRAANCGVTAVTCGGPGTLGRGRPGSETIVLYTGDAEGVVKQWEVFAVDKKLEQWPKLASQRLPKKAHLFQGHDGPVTAILAVDAVKFVSAGSDGTGTLAEYCRAIATRRASLTHSCSFCYPTAFASVRAWNSATGKELFRMDGFPDPIHSLCLLDGVVETTTASNTVLITDGMNKYVCVHDFSTDDKEADYDLEMPEYLNE